MVSCFWSCLKLRKERGDQLRCNDPMSQQSNNKSSVPQDKKLGALKSSSTLLDTPLGGGYEEEEEEGERPEKGIHGDPEWVADMSELFIGNRFASGSNSNIYRGIYKQMAVAVKMAKVSQHDESSRTLIDRQFNSEVSLLSQLHHDNVVQFIAAYRNPPVYCIITEYMSQGTLRMYLNKREPYSLSTKMILKFALDISRGMEYLHSKGVIHRDLKSHNLLLNDELDVKVVDFGISCLDKERHVTKVLGTFLWMAPEMIRGKPCSKKVDVYSYGIVLWELLTALIPFQGMTPEQAAFAVSEKDERPHIPQNCCPAISSLIRRCWSTDPAKRPEFTYIVSMLEQFDECLKDNMPLVPLKSTNKCTIFQRLKGCVSGDSFVSIQVKSACLAEGLS